MPGAPRGRPGIKHTLGSCSSLGSATAGIVYGLCLPTMTVRRGYAFSEASRTSMSHKLPHVHSTRVTTSGVLVTSARSESNGVCPKMQGRGQTCSSQLTTIRAVAIAVCKKLLSSFYLLPPPNVCNLMCLFPYPSCYSAPISLCSPVRMFSSCPPCCCTTLFPRLLMFSHLETCYTVAYIPGLVFIYATRTS